MSISTVSLYVTEACNLRCRYCFLRKQPKRLPLELGRRVMDFMLAAPPDVRQVSVFFFGGEPLLEFGLIRELTLYGRSQARRLGKRLRLGVTTNGTLLDAEAVDFLFDHRLSINLSLDGLPATHDANRRTIDGKGSFHLVDPVIDVLLARNPHQGARMTYDPASVGSLHADHEYLWSRGITQTSPIPVLEAAWDAAALAAANRQLRAIAAAVLDRMRHGDLRRVGFLGKYAQRIHANAPARLRQPCGICNGYIGISTEGVVYPCQRFSACEAYPYGTLDEVTHPDNRRYVLAFDSRRLPACGTCPARMVCAGGCPAVNFVCTGDIYRPWPTQCAFIRMEYAAAQWLYREARREGCVLLDRLVERRNGGRGNGVPGDSPAGLPSPPARAMTAQEG